MLPKPAERAVADRCLPMNSLPFGCSPSGPLANSPLRTCDTVGGNVLGERRGLKGDAVLRGVSGCVDPGEVGMTGIGRVGGPLLDDVAGKGGDIPLDNADGDGGG